MTADKHIHSPEHQEYHPLMLNGCNSDRVSNIKSFEDKGNHIVFICEDEEKTIREYEEGSHWVISEEGKEDRYFGTDINLSIYEPPIFIDMGIDEPSFEHAINQYAKHFARLISVSVEELKYSHTNKGGERCFFIRGSEKAYSYDEAVKRIAALEKEEKYGELISKKDFHKNFKSIKVRCDSPYCGKQIEETKVVSHFCDNWDSDLPLYKKEDEENGKITLENMCVSSCESCEMETRYHFKISVEHKGKPEFIEASDNLEHLIYSDGHYQLEYKGSDFMYDNFMEEMKNGSIVTFYDKSNFFGFDEVKVLNCYHSKERLVYVEGNLYDVIPENTVLLENSVLIYNKEKAVNMEHLYLPEKISDYNETDMVFPKNNKGICFKDKILIIPQAMMKIGSPSHSNIYSQN